MSDEKKGETEKKGEQLDIINLLKKTTVTEASEPAAPAPATDARGGLDPRDKDAKVFKHGAIYDSAKTFEELNLSKDLLTALYEMKFTRPSKIQADALPVILSEKHQNLIAQAHHGSGKTATYSLGMLSRIDVSKARPQAICITPTRELARQVCEVVKTIGKNMKGLSICLAVPPPPTTSSKDEKDKLASHYRARGETVNDHIVVGTPGTVIAKLSSREIDNRDIKMFVVDEADEMVTQGTEGQGDNTVKIRRKLPRDVQVLLFSATFPEKVRNFALAMSPDAVRIIIKREELTLDGIKQFFIRAKNQHQKLDVLMNIFGLLTIGQSIIFVQTRQMARDLCQKLRDKDYGVSLLHGADMPADERDKVMDDFKTGRTTVLISTNVLSRGIDVLQVTLVVNYDLPVTVTGAPDPTTYIHRIGRSGRFGRKGVAINFVHDERSIGVLTSIADYFGATITELPINDPEKLQRFIRKNLDKEV